MNLNIFIVTCEELIHYLFWRAGLIDTEQGKHDDDRT